MIQKMMSQKLLQTIKFTRINKNGFIRSCSGELVSFPVCAVFTWNRYSFMVHPNGDITECSSGARVISTGKICPEEAACDSIPFIESKRYYFSTAVGNILVRYNTNLTAYNFTVVDLSLLSLWI